MTRNGQFTVLEVKKELGVPKRIKIAAEHLDFVFVNHDGKMVKVATARWDGRPGGYLNKHERWLMHKAQGIAQKIAKGPIPKRYRGLGKQLPLPFPI